MTPSQKADQFTAHHRHFPTLLDTSFGSCTPHINSNSQIFCTWSSVQNWKVCRQAGEHFCCSILPCHSVWVRIYIHVDAVCHCLVDAWVCQLNGASTIIMLSIHRLYALVPWTYIIRGSARVWWSYGTEFFGIPQVFSRFVPSLHKHKTNLYQAFEASTY